MDGAAWTVVPSPNAQTDSSLDQNVLLSVKAISPTATAVGFSLDIANQRRLTLIEHWDGARWTVVRSPNVSEEIGALNTLSGVTGSSTDNLYAVGYFATSSIAGQHTAFIEHFDGTA